jgi:hypothetical protein
VRIEHRPATGDTAIKSGGRQPAVGMVSSRRWQAVTHRQTLALSKSGGRQPAVATKRTCNGARFFRNEYIRAPRLAYASRSWLHGVGQLKNNDIRGAQTHVF